jgi:hypothetical protein
VLDEKPAEVSLSDAELRRERLHAYLVESAAFDETERP